MAAAIAVELQRYRASGWRFEKGLAAPPDPRRGLLWCILHLNGERGLSAGRVRYAIAGVVVVAGRNSNRKQAAATATHRRLGLKLGTNLAVGGEAADDRQRR